jgi:hypothetical protein
MSCISLCKYKDIFGKPNEGVHSTRIFGLAFWDLFGMIIIIVILSNYIYYAWAIIPLLTIIIHKVFCVDTAFNKAIGV